MVQEIRPSAGHWHLYIFSVLIVLHNILIVLCNVLRVLCNVLIVLRNVLIVLRNVLIVLRNVMQVLNKAHEVCSSPGNIYDLFVGSEMNTQMTRLGVISRVRFLVSLIVKEGDNQIHKLEVEQVIYFSKYNVVLADVDNEF